MCKEWKNSKASLKRAILKKKDDRGKAGTREQERPLAPGCGTNSR